MISISSTTSSCHATNAKICSHFKIKKILLCQIVWKTTSCECINMFVAISHVSITHIYIFKDDCCLSWVSWLLILMSCLPILPVFSACHSIVWCYWNPVEPLFVWSGNHSPCDTRWIQIHFSSYHISFSVCKD